MKNAWRIVFLFLVFLLLLLGSSLVVATMPLSMELAMEVIMFHFDQILLINYWIKKFKSPNLSRIGLWKPRLKLKSNKRNWAFLCFFGKTTLYDILYRWCYFINLYNQIKCIRIWYVKNFSLISKFKYNKKLTNKGNILSTDGTNVYFIALWLIRLIIHQETVIIVRVPSIKIPFFLAQHRPERDRHRI